MTETEVKDINDFEHRQLTASCSSLHAYIQRK